MYLGEIGICIYREKMDDVLDELHIDLRNSVTEFVIKSFFSRIQNSELRFSRSRTVSDLIRGVTRCDYQDVLEMFDQIQRTGDLETPTVV